MSVVWHFYGSFVEEKSQEDIERMIKDAEKMEVMKPLETADDVQVRMLSRLDLSLTCQSFSRWECKSAKITSVSNWSFYHKLGQEVLDSVMVNMSIERLGIQIPIKVEMWFEINYLLHMHSLQTSVQHFDMYNIFHS